MPLLLAAASAQELHGVSNFDTPHLVPPPPPLLYLAPQTSPLQPSQFHNNIYPYSPFYFLTHQLSNFPTLQPFFFSPSPQVKHVLAGSEYSAAVQQREKALVFGNDVEEEKYTSCRTRGNDPRSLN